MTSLWSDRTVRPFLLLALTIAVLAAFGAERVLSLSTAYGVMQHFATLGPAALALSLTIMVRNFDISIGSTVGLAGCVAVVIGNFDPWLGIAAAIGVGALCGAIQGVIIVRLQLSSIVVTLGGLLIIGGLAFVITANREVALIHQDLPDLLDKPLLGPISLRSVVSLALFVLASALISWTRIGRDILASGSDPKAAQAAGVPVGLIVTMTLVLAGICAALGGSLISYSLAAASPLPLSNVLVPAAAAAIIGGVSLRGGRGHPVGIAGGVLVLAALQSGLTSLGVDPYAQDVVTGTVLLAVGISDGFELQRRLSDLKRFLRPSSYGQAKQ